MASIGLICEGITDHIVIEHIVEGYLQDEDILITYLQPRPIDGEDKYTDGNWDKVLSYCGSSDFVGALDSSPELMVIIHIDADAFRGGDVQQENRFSFNKENGTELSVEEIIGEIRSVIVRYISDDIYEKYRERIIFAIAVDSTECWLLPIFFTNRKAEKTANCINTLNPEINKKYSFTIDKNAKESSYYLKIVKPYLKKKTIDNLHDKNKSLKMFIEDLSQKII